MCKDIGIAKFIDDAHPEQSQDKHVSYGQLVDAMILNGLGFVGSTLHILSSRDHRPELNQVVLNLIAETIQSLDEQGQLFIESAAKVKISQRRHIRTKQLQFHCVRKWLQRNLEHWLLVFSEQRFSCHADAMKMLGIWMTYQPVCQLAELMLLSIQFSLKVVD